MKEHNFKVGDKVRVVCNGTSNLCTGVEGHVTKDCEGGTGAVRVGTKTASWFYGNSGGKLELVKDEYPNPPHKYQDLIIEWAKGAVIEKAQYLRQDAVTFWHIVIKPTWEVDSRYRVRPATIKSPKDLEVDRIEEEMRIISEKQLKLAEDLANLK